MADSVFLSGGKYLFPPLKDDMKATISTETDEQIISQMESILQNSVPGTDDLLVKSLLEFTNVLMNSSNADLLSNRAVSIIHGLVPLINHEDQRIQALSYSALHHLATISDQDELAESMMDQLICIEWAYDNRESCYKTARLSIVYVELFGKALEKMTKARDWMLFLPFVANYLVKVVNAIEPVLVKESYFSSASKPSKWDTIVTLVSNNCLDFAIFVHSRTVAQDCSEFPFDSRNIGKEDGNVRRRYLGYFLLNLLFDKVVAHFDMQMSKEYFELQNPKYKMNRPDEKDIIKTGRFNDASYKPMFDIFQRTFDTALKYGLTFEKAHQLQTSLVENVDWEILPEDEAMENDRQMINSRLYPLSYNGIAVLFSLSLYRKTMPVIESGERKEAVVEGPESTLETAKQYIGIILNLITRSPDRVCQADKGIFALLYLSNHITTTLTMEKLEKTIAGPCGFEDSFPVARIIEILTTAASTCPDPSIRFLTLRLVDKFIDYGDEETQVYLFTELLQRCPFPSMRTAAVGLLKDRINRAFSEGKRSSLFSSPLVVSQFIPVILKFKDEWTLNNKLFWGDYNYIMHALNFYYLLLSKDEKLRLTTIWNVAGNIYKEYIVPLSNLLDALLAKETDPTLEMQMLTMKNTIGLICNK